jgi:hypothetical protein
MPEQSGAPLKVRWTVPAVDVSVIRWLRAQKKIQQSLRLLVREAIERYGYIDVVYRPVEPLSRPDGSPQPPVGAERRTDGQTGPDPAPPTGSASVPAEEPEESAGVPPAPQVSIDEIMARRE